MRARNGINKSSSFWGETTAFLSLFLDNVGVFIFMSAILIFTFRYPSEIILTRMIPGTAVGVFFGDLVYTWMALRLRKKTGRTDVTAMPLGLDTPSTIGLAYSVIGPAYLATRNAELTWQIGMATLFLIGVVKVIISFFGARIQRTIPTAGILGALAGLGLLILGFLPLIEIFNSVIVGMVALGIIFAVLIGRMNLPGRIPGVLLAVLLGTAIHFILGFSGYLNKFEAPNFTMSLCFPVFSIDFLQVLPESIKYLPIAIPFAILTIIGGISNTESARLAGDDYRTRDILLTEALTSLIAAFFGGVAQTTPYLGHPAYKKMGARYWYTLMTGLLIGAGAIIGFLSMIVSIIPRAVLSPIFIFIGLEIVRQAYEEVPSTHFPAVSFSFLPVAADLVMIILNQFLAGAGIATDKLPAHLQIMMQSLTVLSNGFIVTAILWGSILALLIDQKPKQAALCAFSCAVLSVFGVIHSIFPNGEVYLPWKLSSNLHYMIALAYALVTVVFLNVKPLARHEE